VLSEGVLLRGCLAVSFVLALGCGASTAAQFDGTVYKKGPVAFQVAPAPSSWRRIEVTEASLAFRDDLNRASVVVNARCLTADDRTPLVALTNHLLIGATEREFEIQKVEPFDGREALHTRLAAKWDGVPMKMDVWVLSKDGCVYDFVYLAPPDIERFVRGFRTLRGSGAV
jgi:hypothetical protein